MSNIRLHEEIRELNLSYLVMAQSAIRTDKAVAMFQLGMSEPIADMLAELSPQQMVRIAARNQVLFSFRFDDELIWGLLTDSHQPRAGQEGNAGQLHASVLMAGGREPSLAKA
ncbi:flagellar transcriptional regulator FlhD [Ramlibacter sp. AW1]|uniref:Flagellar transcriptional regulator FlhD n=1 Tax=Ramlibacter aurantiacus TaxID=2801330 RepID=A0A937D2B8_9BURK|nr:flagellar transcriptional regulator FlhD [Ramlibacter aurantiacus]MBL0421444.1 flagellar transcriptional regulator FlhD [Ramlibacter aurantiacus]